MTQLYDPLQDEEDILRQQLKVAIAKTLRTSAGNTDIMGAGHAAFDRVSGMLEAKNAQNEIKNLSQRREQKSRDAATANAAALAEALRDQDPDVQRLMTNPATRAAGLELIKERAKAPKEPQPMDPKNYGRMNPDGSMGEVPGAYALYERQLKAKEAAANPMGYEVTNSYGGKDRVQPPTGGALPGATGGLPSPAAAPTQAPSPASGPSALGRSVAAKSMVEMGPPDRYDSLLAQESGGRHTDANGRLTTSSKGAEGISQMMPATQRDPGYGVVPPQDKSPGEFARSGRDYFNAMMKKYGGNEELAAAAYNAGPGTVDKTLAESQRTGRDWKSFLPGETKDYLAKVLGVGSAQAQALPQSAGSQGVPQPGQQGGPNNPPAQEVWKDRAKNDDDIRKEQMQKAPGGGAALYALSQLRDMNAKPTYSGPLSGVLEKIDAFAGGSQRGADTTTMKSKIASIIGPLLKQYGTNPSNVDLRAVATQLPSMEDTPLARKQIIDMMERGIHAELMVRKAAAEQLAEYGRRNIAVDPTQIMEQEWGKFNDNRAREEQAKRATNPTPAGGARQALPGAVAEPGMLDRYMKFMEPASEFGQDVRRSASNLPGAFVSKTGGEAIGDSWGNTWEGAKQLFGQGDREKSKFDRAAQDERARIDPDYNQMKTFGDVFNPVSMVGGPTAKGIVGAAGLAGLTQPQDDWSQQIVQGLKNAALAAPFAAASKLIPSTKVASKLNVEGEGDKLLGKFPSVNPTASQLSPGGVDSALARGVGLDEAASLDQARAITYDLMKSAGMPGKELSPTQFFKVGQEISQGYNKLFPKGVAAKIDSVAAANLHSVLKNNPMMQQTMGKAPALGQILEAASNGKPFNVKLPALHQAWKEIGQSGADAHTAGMLRDSLEGIIAKALPQGNIAPFKELNRRWGEVRDLERVWRGGGSGGVGEAAGLVNPAKFVAEAGTGPNSGVMTDEAARLINKYNIRNPRGDQVEPSVAGAAKYGVQSSIGKLLRKLDFSNPRAGKFEKSVMDALQAGARIPGTSMRDNDWGMSQGVE